MANLAYTATRSLADGSTGSIDFDVENNPPEPRVKRHDHTPLNGDQSYIVFHYREKFINVRTVPVSSSQRKFFQEFEDSVSENEEFTYDELGSLSTPVNPKTCQMVQGSFSETRFGPNHYVFAFRVKVL